MKHEHRALPTGGRFLQQKRGPLTKNMHSAAGNALNDSEVDRGFWRCGASGNPSNRGDMDTRLEENVERALFGIRAEGKEHVKV